LAGHHVHPPGGWRSSDRRRGLVIDRGETVMPSIRIIAALAALAAASTSAAIAIFSKSRLPALPNLATAHEQGLADFEIIPWYAFFLPKGTPAQIVRRLREATVATMETLAI